MKPFSTTASIRCVLALTACATLLSSAALGQVILTAEPAEAHLKVGQLLTVRVAFDNLGDAVVYVPKVRPAGDGCWEGFVATITPANGKRRIINCPTRSISVSNRATDSDLVQMMETSWKRLEPFGGTGIVLQLPATVFKERGRTNIAIKYVAHRLAKADIARLKRLGFANIAEGEYRAKPFAVVVQ